MNALLFADAVYTRARPCNVLAVYAEAMLPVAVSLRFVDVMILTYRLLVLEANAVKKL